MFRAITIVAFLLFAGVIFDAKANGKKLKMHRYRLFVPISHPNV